MRKIEEHAIVSMPTLTFPFITQNQDVRGSTNYSFSDFPRLDKQFDTIFKKIGATLFFHLRTNSGLTFDLQRPVT